MVNEPAKGTQEPDHPAPPAASAAGALPALVVAMLLCALAGRPAGAELVVFATGEVLKIAAYEVGESEARLVLPSGGRLTVAIGRLERIVDDEIVPDPPPIEEPEGLVLTFRDGHPVPSTPYGELIFDVAKRHGINPQLVVAMVATESAFRPDAVSRKGARGLLQLMPATASRFGVDGSELFDPVRNLEAGVRYLGWLFERFEWDAELALAAYNAGEGAVDRYGGVPPYRETLNYVRRVLERAQPDVAVAAGST